MKINDNTKKKMIQIAKSVAIGYATKQFYDKNNREYIYDSVVTNIGHNFHIASQNTAFNCTIQWIQSLNNKRMNLYINSCTSNRTYHNGLEYTIEEGYYKFLYKNCLVIIKVKCTGNNQINPTSKININFIGINSLNIKNSLIRFINNELRAIKNKQRCSSSTNENYIEYCKYISSQSCNTKYIATRDLNSIFSDQLDDIISILEKWKKLRGVYSSHALPFKTGMLLYGKPGTGKTTMIRAIATYFKMRIINVNLATISFKELELLSDRLDVSNQIIILEEIDLGVSIADSDTSDINPDKEKKIQLLLTLLDGLECRDNVIFIATTNHIERLDPRIQRSGRFDNLIEVTDIRKETAIEMCKSFGINDNEIEKILDKDVFTGKLYNPADLQNEILKYISKDIK